MRLNLLIARLALALAALAIPLAAKADQEELYGDPEVVVNAKLYVGNGLNGAAARLRLYAADGEYVEVRPPEGMATPWNFTLPDNAGAVGDILTNTDGAGATGWSSAASLGLVNYWSRSGIILTPATGGDYVEVVADVPNGDAAVYGEATGIQSEAGVKGTYSGSGTFGYGVWGESAATQGIAVAGVHTDLTGEGEGVHGASFSSHNNAHGGAFYRSNNGAGLYAQGQDWEQFASDPDDPDSGWREWFRATGPWYKDSAGNQFAYTSKARADSGTAYSRHGINLIAGSNVTITPNDDSAGDEVEFTIAASGGSGYSTVQEEGSDLTARAKLNFVGGGITAADDAGNSRTNVTLDSELNAIAAVTSGADKLPYFTGSGTAGTTDLSSFARTYLDESSAGNTRSVLGAAASGANSDITSMTGLTGGISGPTYIQLATGLSPSAPGSGLLDIYASSADDHPYAYNDNGEIWDLVDGGWTISAVTGSNNTNTGTTLANITGLSFACAANTLYEFEAVLIAGTSAVTTGTKYGVQYSAAGATVGCEVSGTVTNTTGAVTSLQALNSSTATTFLTTSSVKGFIRMHGWLQTGANTGNLTIQDLKVTSGTSTVYIGSVLKVRKAGS